MKKFPRIGRVRKHLMSIFFTSHILNIKAYETCAIKAKTLPKVLIYREICDLSHTANILCICTHLCNAM